MRTKTLLLTAAVAAAGVASAMAQGGVYSVNSVGYVNLNLPAQLSIISVPLRGTNDNLNTAIPSIGPESNEGSIIYRWSPSRQGFRDAITYFNGFGWFATEDPTGPDGDPMIITPGEGFFIQLNTAAAITFVGEVMQGSLATAVPGGGQFGIKASQVPQALPIGDTSINKTNSLEFPATPDDILYLWDPTIQNYKDAYTYFDGFGWFSANTDDPGPKGPTIPVGTGFWTQKAGPAASWTRTFSVN